MANTPKAKTSTADSLIDAAEALFADQGFEAASLRAVMRAADSDPGAVHYHFGGREQLAAAVLDRVLAPLNARRLELLDGAELQAGSGSIPLDALLYAIVRPDLEVATDLASRGSGRARLIGAIYINPAAFVTERVELHFQPVAARFMPHMMAAAPDVPPDLASWRIRWSVFGMLGALMSDRDPSSALGLEELTNRIVSTATAAVGAVSTTSTAGG